MSTNEQSQMSGPGLGVRGKLGLGFAALLAILIFLGAESIALLSDLGRSIEVILREPVFQQIKDTADEILLLNQRSMEEADARAGELAADATRRMTLLLILGTALAALSVYLLSRAILRPLGALTRAAHEIEGGNLDAEVPVTSRDELGRLAATFNSMAGGLRELRRSDQARLLRAQRTSQQAVDQLPEAVAVFSEDGEVELVNATAAAVLGLRPGEPLPSRHETWISLLVNPGRGMVPSQEIRRLERDGREALFLPRAIPLGEEGRRLGTLLVLEDVTERRRRDELTSELLAAACRDLRSPLASLRAALANLQAWRNREALEAAARDASRMAEVLDNLEGITRMEDRRQQLRVQAVSPRDLIQAAADEFRPSYQRNGVRLAVEDAPELPRVLADPERARLVLSFLLDNALANTPPGGSATVRAEADGERVRFAVADDGRGIPEEHQARLFERFYQVPGSEDRGRAGLGLSIARDIVQSHGGEIHLESREGLGTTVWFTLPAARSAAA